MICTWCLVHSLAVVEVTFLLVAVGKVAPLLKGVDVLVAVLEVVVGKVASTSVAIVSGTRSSKWSTLK